MHVVKMLKLAHTLQIYPIFFIPNKIRFKKNSLPHNMLTIHVCFYFCERVHLYEDIKYMLHTGYSRSGLLVSSHCQHSMATEMGTTLNFFTGSWLIE